MRIALFGSTGRVGRAFLEQALAAGHELTVLVRRAPAVAPDARVRVIVGDATDAADVRRAIEGADVVVSALGPAKGAPHDVNTRWTRVALDAMRELGVRRIVVVSGAAAGPPPSDMAPSDRAFRAFISRFVKAPYQDKVAQLALLEASDRDWVALRPPAIVDGPRTGAYRMGDVRIGRRFQVSVGDVADALLRHAALDAPARVMPFLAGA